MQQNIDTVIFDMDGVIIESAHLWKRAEKEIFSSVGVEVSEELSKQTTTMTTEEVTKFWYQQQPWDHKPLDEVENGVINRVAQLIAKEGEAIPGIEDLVYDLKSKGYKIGLATNAPSVLIPVVLDTVKLHNFFDAISSADDEKEVNPKPDPSVYLSVAGKLGSDPGHCLAIEDSGSGVMAARKAGMKTVLITNGKTANKRNEIADFTIDRYDQFYNCLRV